MRGPGVDHPHLGSPRLAGEGFVERRHCCLRRSVGGHAGQVLLGDQAGDVDDHAAGSEVRERSLGESDLQQ